MSGGGSSAVTSPWASWVVASGVAGGSVVPRAPVGRSARSVAITIARQSESDGAPPIHRPRNRFKSLPSTTTAPIRSPDDRIDLDDPAQLHDLVAEERRLLEFQVPRRRFHLRLEVLDQTRQLVLRHLGDDAVLRRAGGPVLALFFRDGADAIGEVLDLLNDTARLDTVLLVVGHLDGATTVGLVDRGLHGPRHVVRVHDDLSVDVAGRPADRLDQRALRPEVPLLVGIEDGDERDLRQIESLAQEVDSDDDVIDPEPEIAQDFDPLKRLDLA